MILLDDTTQRVYLSLHGFTFHLSYDDIDKYRRQYTKINVPRKIYELATGDNPCSNFLEFAISNPGETVH